MSLLDTNSHHQWPQQRRLHSYLALARISNSPTVVTNVLAGAALAGVPRPGVTIALLAVAMVLFYTAGMFLNDLCDYATDLRERPERPLTSGAISRTEAAIAIVAMFVVGSALLLYVGPIPFASGLVLIAVIVLYDVWHKTNPFGPLVMALARAMVYVTAFLAFSTGLSALPIVPVGLAALYVVSLTYIAKSETGPAVKRFWPVVALLLPAAYFAFQISSAILLLVPVLFAGWVAYGASFAYRHRGRNIGGAVGRLIAGIALYDGLVLAAAGAVTGVVMALAAFGATLFFQRYIRGT
jgi:4-hydroxybenzoate polyprenyltransferase